MLPISEHVQEAREGVMERPEDVTVAEWRLEAAMAFLGVSLAEAVEVVRRLTK